MVWGHQALQGFIAIPSLPLSGSTIQGHITTPYSYVTVTSHLLINFLAPYLPYTSGSYHSTLTFYKIPFLYFPLV